MTAYTPNIYVRIMGVCRDKGKGQRREGRERRKMRRMRGGGVEEGEELNKREKTKELRVRGKEDRNST